MVTPWPNSATQRRNRGFTARHPRGCGEGTTAACTGPGRAMVALFQVGRGPWAFPLCREFLPYIKGQAIHAES